MTIYKSINHKFYAQRDAAHHRGGDGSSAHTTGAAHSTAEPVQEITDDANGYYVPVVGELIANRYAVVAVLGKGSFGVVVQCVDEKYQESVAVKIIRSGPYFSAQGQLEADIVAYLNRNPLLENLVVQLRKAFVWKTHIVLVFEMLSIDLYQLIELTKFNGVSLDLTRKFAYQLLQVLLQLEQHEPPIIHCDLKPENVLLRDPSRSGIRVIDFGSSCYQQVASWSPLHGGSAQGSSTGSGMASEATARRQGEESAAQKAKTSPPPAEGQRAETAGESRDAGGGGPSTSQPTTRDKTFEYAIMPKYIQSRFYRSPEVILELGYTTAIDRWSLGCMLVELHTGIPLFPGRNEASMLALFTAVLGPLPDFMIAASPKAAQFFSTTSATTTTTTARAGSPASGDAPRSTAAPLKATESAPSKPSVPAAAPWADTPAVRAPEEPSSVLNMSQPEGDHSFPLSSWVGSTLSPISVAPPRAMDNSSTVMSSVQWEKDGTSGPPTSPYVLRHQTSPQASRTLSQVLGVESGGPRGCRKGQQGHDVESYALFFDFVHQLLEYDPRRRMSCAAAMSHPFLQPLREWEARATQARQQQQQQQQLPPS